MTDSKPDSLLTAARKVAEFSGMPWPRVQKYYRELQVDDGRGSSEAWLPKSVGATVWYAGPELVARLLIALTAAEPEQGPEVVAWARDLFPSGTPGPRAQSKLYGGVLSAAFEQHLALLLQNAPREPELHPTLVAERVRSVEIIIPAREARISYLHGAPPQLWVGTTQAPQAPGLSQLGGSISGELLAKLRDNVRWKQGAPYKVGGDQSEAVDLEDMAGA